MNQSTLICVALLIGSLAIVNGEQAFNVDCTTSEACNCDASILTCRFDNTTTHVKYVETENITRLVMKMASLKQLTFQRKELRLRSVSVRCNKFESIPKNQFENVPNLVSLDLSMNYIRDLREEVFAPLQKLESLNLSEAIEAGVKLDRQLCELVALKSIDLGYLDLEDLNMECWKNIRGNLVELHLKHTKNAAKSWANWFPYIGDKLELLDLTNANLRDIDPDLARKPNLNFLALSHNPSIDKHLIVNMLKTENLIDRLKHLYLANITADSNSFNIDAIINQSQNLSLIELDLSQNNYSDVDLNIFLFNQAKFKRLKSFIGQNTNFTGCVHGLFSNDTTLLPSLENLDISNNGLTGSSCLYPIRLCKSLRRLDMSHNKLNLLHSELVSNNMVSIFADMTNLSYIDLSYNKIIELTLNFKPYHARIEKFDISHNNLYKFRFLSQHSIQSSKFPFNLEDEAIYDYDYMESETLNIGNKNDKNDPNYFDDDERFLLIDELRLEDNHLKHVNLQHMLQSVRNIKVLDLSHNPIENVIRLSGERSLFDNAEPLAEDELTEILCVDELDLSNCKIRHLPNFEHTCINKISLAYNSLENKQHLVISKFSTYFMDYMDLQWNNITELKPIISNQKFKQDDYSHKNSPTSYFMGSESTQLTSSEIHTYVDLKNNRQFKCDCELITQFRKYISIQLLNECMDDVTFQEQCFAKERQTMESLNRKFRLIFGFIAVLLFVLTNVLIYYMCNDCIRNMQPYERVSFVVRQFLCHFRSKHSMDSDGISPTGNIRQSHSSKVIYSKLDNETNASNVNLDI